MPPPGRILFKDIRAAVRPVIVMHHKTYLGLTVSQNLIAQSTMYTVELDPLGLFISDSRPEAFNRAFEAPLGLPAPDRTA